MPTTAGISERLGDDRGVASRPADFGDESEDELAIEIGRFAGGQVVRQDDRRRSERAKSLRAGGPADCAAAASRCRRCRWPARPVSCV